MIRILTQYNEVAQGKSEVLPDFTPLSEIQDNPGEAELLLKVQDVIDSIEEYTVPDRERMLECLDVIVEDNYRIWRDLELRKKEEKSLL